MFCGIASTTTGTINRLLISSDQGMDTKLLFDENLSFTNMVFSPKTFYLVPRHINKDQLNCYFNSGSWSKGNKTSILLEALG